MKTTFHPKRLLLEVLLVVALAALVTFTALPFLAPDLRGAPRGLLAMALMLLLAGPALYWRLMAALRGGEAAPMALRLGYGHSSQALWLTAATQLLGLLLTAGGVAWQYHQLQELSRARFARSAERVEAEVTRRLNQAVPGLKGARGALAMQPDMRRQAFHDYVNANDLGSDFVGVRGFGFIQRVRRDALERFVAAERADGAPDFRVNSQGLSDDLYVVRFVEPLADNRAALGYDLSQDPVRRRVVEFAVDSGQPTLMAGISLLHDTRHSAAVIYLLPVYRKGSNPQSVEERRRDLLGLLYAPMMASELFGSVTAATAEPLDFELFDGDVIDEKHLIYDADGHIRDSAPGTDPVASRNFSVTHALTVGNRPLTLRASSSSYFDRLQDRSSLPLIGAGGTLVSCLMAISVWLLAVGRQRAQDLAEAMTVELDHMAQVVQHTDNGVTIMNRDMRIQWVNQGFTRISGYNLEEARGHTPDELLHSGQSDPQALHALRDSCRRGVACRVEVINRARDGHTYWASTEVQPMFGKNGALAGFMEISTDISVQKQTQLRLEAAMRDARALLDTLELHAIVSSTDANGCITSVNDAFCRISGYSREELIGRSHRIVNSGVQSAAFWSHLWKTVGSGKPWRGEICNRAKDGSLFWVDSMIAPFVSEDGRIERYVSIRTDITERRLSAERLRQSEATFAAAFQDAASGMAMLSPQGQWLMANPAMCQFLGMGSDVLHTITLLDVSHPDEWDTDRAEMERLLAGEMRVYQRAKRYVRADGETVWGLASLSVVRSDDGTPEFVIAQVVDITARRRAEEALRLSNSLMEESQSVAHVGGWELNLATGDLYWTREVHHIYGTNPEDYVPEMQSALDFYLPASRERLEAAVQQALDQGQGYDLELEARTVQGERIDVRTTGSATREGGRVVRLSGILQDITAQKEYARTLREATERAEQATRSKGQFLANMSHEIRTPMNAILGMLKLLNHTGLNSRQRDYAEKIEGAAQSLLGLINDILDFSKVEAGKMQLDAQPFRVNRLMRNLSVILSSNLGAKPVEVLFDIDPRIPGVLLGDALRLQQVLINLGGNAVKFTARGQVVVSLRLEQLQATVAEVEFAVKDSGIGIAPENQAHIFTGFSQAEASTTRQFGGTGLGLAISQRLVELMGGELRLRSALGEGSTFSFTLRLPLVLQVPPELQEPEPQQAQRRRVLVVDSNATARELLQRMVRSWNWSCETTDCGEAALELVAARLQAGTEAFEVIYLDWNMSGMDGWATAAQLRQLYGVQGAAQPVLVMVSGNSREALEQRTLEEQQLLNGFLVKPVTASMLLEAALDSTHSEARIRQSRRGQASERRLEGMRLLVVEDNLLNQQVAEELLSTEGALVSLAANGRLGVDAIAAAARTQQFDAVLMDVQMPVLDGFAATRLVREELGLKDLPIIAMTANALASDRADCLAAGMNEHVGKPFDLRHLVNTLRDVTGYHPPAGAARGYTVPAELAPEPAAPVAAGPIDVAGALARLGGHQTLYAQAARDFVSGLPTELAALQRAATDPAAGALCRRLAHTLKGTAATLGAQALSEMAAHIEKRCQSGPVGAPTLERLAQLAQEATEALQRVLGGMDAQAVAGGASAPPTSGAGEVAAALRPALAELMPLLEADDFSALEQFARLRGQLELAPATLFAALEQALQELELEQAAQACQQMQAWLDAGAERLQPASSS